MWSCYGGEMHMMEVTSDADDPLTFWRFSRHEHLGAQDGLSEDYLILLSSVPKPVMPCACT